MIGRQKSRDIDRVECFRKLEIFPKPEGVLQFIGMKASLHGLDDGAEVMWLVIVWEDARTLLDLCFMLLV